MKWNPSACDGTEIHVITYGAGSGDDKTFVLANTDNKLSYDANTKTLKVLKDTDLTKAGTDYKIYVTAKTSNNVVIPVGDNNQNKQTISLTIIDPCLTDKATWETVAQVKYKLGGAQ